jgi:hypothetical protein
MPDVYSIMAVQLADCETCGADRGKPCTTNGRPSKGCHWRRKSAVQAWRKNGHQAEYKRMMGALKLGPEYGLSGC